MNWTFSGISRSPFLSFFLMNQPSLTTGLYFSRGGLSAFSYPLRGLIHASFFINTDEVHDHPCPLLKEFQLLPLLQNYQRSHLPIHHLTLLAPTRQHSPRLLQLTLPLVPTFSHLLFIVSSVRIRLNHLSTGLRSEFSLKKFTSSQIYFVYNSLVHNTNLMNRQEEDQESFQEEYGFELQEAIGEGSFGTVYEALH